MKSMVGGEEGGLCECVTVEDRVRSDSKRRKDVFSHCDPVIVT